MPPKMEALTVAPFAPSHPPLQANAYKKYLNCLNCDPTGWFDCTFFSNVDSLETILPSKASLCNAFKRTRVSVGPQLRSEVFRPLGLLFANSAPTELLIKSSYHIIVIGLLFVYFIGFTADKVPKVHMEKLRSVK